MGGEKNKTPSSFSGLPAASFGSFQGRQVFFSSPRKTLTVELMGPFFMIICYCYRGKEFAAVGSRDRNGFVTFAPCSYSPTTQPFPVVQDSCWKVVFRQTSFFLLLVNHFVNWTSVGLRLRLPFKWNTGEQVNVYHTVCVFNKTSIEIQKVFVDKSWWIVRAFLQFKVQLFRGNTGTGRLLSQIFCVLNLEESAIHDYHL